jgi:AraC-like DNA-binding protein
MLREQPEKPILDVALECGFSSSQHFSTAFRRVKRCAPRDLRLDAA